jgi:hypothetical protein
VYLLSVQRDAVCRRDEPHETEVRSRAYRMSKAGSTAEWVTPDLVPRKHAAKRPCCPRGPLQAELEGAEFMAPDLRFEQESSQPPPPGHRSGLLGLPGLSRRHPCGFAVSQTATRTQRDTFGCISSLDSLVREPGLHPRQGVWGVSRPPAKQMKAIRGRAGRRARAHRQGDQTAGVAERGGARRRSGPLGQPRTQL